MALTNRQRKNVNKQYNKAGSKAAKKGQIKLKAKSTAKALGKVAKVGFKAGKSKTMRDDKRLKKDLSTVKKMRANAKSASKDKSLVKGARKDSKKVGRLLGAASLAARGGAAAGRAYKFTSARKAALMKAVRASAAKRRGKRGG